MADDRSKPRPHRTTLPTTLQHSDRTPVRPHRRDNAADSSAKDFDLNKMVTEWASKNADQLSETYWGDRIARKESTAREYFAIPAKERLYLVLDTTIMQSCKIGLALCDSGVWLRDERKKQRDIPWREFVNCSCQLDGSNLMIDGNKFISSDSTLLRKLLLAIQQRLRS